MHSVPHPALGPAPFIVGVGRSGTTLLRLMLDAHSQLAIPAETHFIPVMARLRGKGDALRKKFYDEMVAYGTWNDFNLSPEEFRQELLKISDFRISAGLRSFYGLYAAKQGKTRWGDKTPTYCVSLDVIAEVLPEARFIHLIRDGRDVALSMRDLWFGRGRDLRAQGADWAGRILRARRLSRRVSHYLEVRYEDLVLDPEGTLKQVCSFIKIPYDEGMLRYHERAGERLGEMSDRLRPREGLLVTGEQRRGIHRNTERPPDPGLLYKWRTLMSPEERRAFEQVAGGMLREIGYESSEADRTVSGTLARWAYAVRRFAKRGRRRLGEARKNR